MTECVSCLELFSITFEIKHLYYFVIQNDTSGLNSREFLFREVVYSSHYISVEIYTRDLILVVTCACISGVVCRGDLYCYWNVLVGLGA